ncbi:protein phosphatase 1, regulatory subunit 13Ba isoform X3 [Astyanax mexicanus]|uniref:protein phosphatase 1, regulatory subunit 13Ba isoform X3 n=1 Tax=Astyanax mexicanus TaxID=7994 RepID=UPI0020CAA5BA|nr:protein phosphatase 1, regulatory subunit 13Ba isoform X3 [Astyanax mexicanus]
MDHELQLLNPNTLSWIGCWSHVSDPVQLGGSAVSLTESIPYTAVPTPLTPSCPDLLPWTIQNHPEPFCVPSHSTQNLRTTSLDQPGQPADMMPMIISVFLSDNEQLLTEVPITAETLCKDVVEFCKEAGESGCHLAEVWRGNERKIPSNHPMLEHLQKWGQRRQEVKFYLRREDPPARPSEQGGQPVDQASRTSRGKMDKPCENGVGTPRVEMTLSELQEMAIRQQQQIEAQQQMLVAKLSSVRSEEQRLRYLKQQDPRQAGCEPEKLQKLREQVESQEAKLKKIRAMRGQVDYSKIINSSLSTEIEHVSSLFQEKQAELQHAVLKVDQLTQQLDDLRHGRINSLQPVGAPLSGTAALELRKLYQELQIRNKLNQEQNSKLQQHKDMLNKRNLEVTMMDKRIEDLRERLYKKKAELSRMGGPPSPQPGSVSSGRVAAVFPYIQVPAGGRQDGGYTLPPDPLKPHTLPAPINHIRSKSANDANWPSFTESKAPDWKDASRDPGSMAGGDKDSPKVLGTITALSRQPPPIYGTYPSAGHHSTVCATSSLPRSAPGTLSWQRAPPTCGSSSQQIQQRITVPPSPTSQSSSPFAPQSDRTEPPLAAAVRPFITDRGSRPQSPRKGPATMNSSSIYHMYLQQPTSKNYPSSSSSRAAIKAVYGKPVLPGSASASPVPFLHQTSRDESDRDAEPEGTPNPAPAVDGIPRPLSPTKLTPVAHSPLRYQSDADLEVLRRKLANAPRPLKKRSSITEPEGPSGPNIQKLLYQRFNTLAGGMESSVGVPPFFQPDSPLSYMGLDTANGNLLEPGILAAPIAETPVPEPSGPSSSPTADTSENGSADLTESDLLTDTSASVPPPKDSPEDSHYNNQNNQTESTETQPSPPPETQTSSTEEEEPIEEPGSAASGKRTNLKKPGSERTGHGLRVKFNPLALLLDASLEGEFDLVQRIIYEVQNPSTPNDEGITPLHNAVCAGHHHIVKFLLDFGVNVNAADSDGWTPLHCAASCNSVHLCKLLVESGAAIFATTISDVETAADKCEEMEEGYIQCSQFLYGVQEKLGVMNKGAVYALWDYKAQSSDELSFSEGDALTVLRRRDDSETEWWWARLNNQEGYVPRNLLGLYPRIKPRQRSLA